MLVSSKRQVYTSLTLLLPPLTHEPQALHVGTLGPDDAPEALLLQGTVGLVQVGLSVAVHCAPLAVQHSKTVTGNEIHGQI